MKRKKFFRSYRKHDGWLFCHCRGKRYGHGETRRVIPPARDRGQRRMAARGGEQQVYAVEWVDGPHFFFFLSFFFSFFLSKT